MRVAPLAALAIAVTSFASAASAAEPAEPPISNPNEIVTSVSETSMVALLTELGATKIETRDVGNGRKQIVFYDGATPYNLVVGVCNVRPGKCVGFSMVAVIEMGNNAYSLDALNAVNRDNLFLTMFKADSTKVGAGHVHLVDGGVAKKNIAINIASFIVTLNDVMKALQNQLVAGYQQGGGFQRAGFGAPRPHLIVASPQHMREASDQLSRQYARTLRH
jgi:hypothetical protein